MIVLFISTKCVYYLRIMNSEKLVVIVLYHSINRYLHEISEMYLHINSVTQTRLESIIKSSGNSILNCKFACEFMATGYIFILLCKMNKSKCDFLSVQFCSCDCKPWDNRNSTCILNNNNNSAIHNDYINISWVLKYSLEIRLLKIIEMYKN